jgi:hypothetical protein
VILTIDNLDGKGVVDYSGCLCPDGPLKIERTLNAPSSCHAMLELGGGSLMVPVRRGRVVVTSTGGTVLFTGYVATEPELVYAGAATEGSVYRVALNAISDEWLLDKQVGAAGGAGLAQAGGEVLKTLTNRVDASVFSTTAVADGRAVGVFEPVQTARWSENAGSAASATYTAYRVLNGALTLQPAGTVTHALSDGNGTLQVSALKTSTVKELANDVTVSGEIEPAAYVTETFAGDATTSVFQLSETPFKSAAASRGAQIVNDSFNQAAINPQAWYVTDPGSHLGLSAAGLTMTGGNGLDGQTTLTAIDKVELGGSIVIEAGNVQLGAASDGVVCGLYAGATQRSNCFAGYNVRQNNGSTVVVPFVNGAEVGTVFTMIGGHAYTMRIRLHCVEMQRVLQTYYAMVDGVVEAFGGGLVSAPMAVVFELQDLGAASNTPATVLYDGAVATSPAICSFAAVNSVQLVGSMGYCRVTEAGSAWIVSTLPSGVKETRLIGNAGEGVDCSISASGKVTFVSGRVPVAGEFVTVLYRGRERAVARLQDAASVATEAAGGMPGSAGWLGRVVQPKARSSADCESAAQAVLSFATSRAAAVAGAYEAVNLADVWPGDVLAVTSGAQTMNVVVRTVAIEDGNAWPEMLTYRIAFANDWAEGLGLKLSEAIATDAVLPQTALNSPLTAESNVLANLQQLQLVNASTMALQVDTGTNPPVDGGFEVRRRDWAFGPSVDQDLVLRSPVRGFSIPREGQVERYYVRMFDASNPPLYSRFSAAVFTDLPLS